MAILFGIKFINMIDKGIKIVTEYIGNSGDKVVIANMPDSYLLNSYVKYKKRVELLEKAESKFSKSTGPRIQSYQNLLKSIAYSLKLEVEKRCLI